MKKLKSLFLTVMSSLLLLVSCIKTNDKTSIEEVNYNYQPKSAFRYILDDSVNLLDGKLDGGFGGGAGLAIAAVVGAFIGGSSSSTTSNGFTISGGSKTTPSNLSLGGVVEKHPDLKKKMKDNGVTTDEAKEIIRTFLGLASITKLYKNTKKVLCIGRDLTYYSGSKYIKSYNQLAVAGGYSSFYVKDYKQKLIEFGAKSIECANLLLVYYCCDNNWDFICATHPYMYIHTKGSYLPEGGYSYRLELETIRKSGYNYVGGYTWNTLPPPTWGVLYNDDTMIGGNPQVFTLQGNEYEKNNTKEC